MNKGSMIVYTDVRSLLDPKIFRSLYAKVSIERQQDIDKKRFEEDKLLSLAGGVLMDQLLRKYGVSDPNRDDSDEKIIGEAGKSREGMLIYDESGNDREGVVLHDVSGKPYVKDHPELYISLTHSYPYAAAILSESPCGIDIESRDRNLSTVMNRFYTEEEKAFCYGDAAKAVDGSIAIDAGKAIDGSSEIGAGRAADEGAAIADQSKVTDIWCRKECVIKFAGPVDVRKIDTFAIPISHRYLSIPLPGFSFEVLLSKEEASIVKVELTDGVG